jgi:hypothetical protein
LRHAIFIWGLNRWGSNPSQSKPCLLPLFSGGDVDAFLLNLPKRRGLSARAALEQTPVIRDIRPDQRPQFRVNCGVA